MKNLTVISDFVVLSYDYFKYLKHFVLSFFSSVNLQTENKIKLSIYVLQCFQISL